MKNIRTRRGTKREVLIYGFLGGLVTLLAALFTFFDFGRRFPWVLLTVTFWAVLTYLTWRAVYQEEPRPDWEHPRKAMTIDWGIAGFLSFTVFYSGFLHFVFDRVFLVELVKPVYGGFITEGIWGGLVLVVSLVMVKWLYRSEDFERSSAGGS